MKNGEFSGSTGDFETAIGRDEFFRRHGLVAGLSGAIALHGNEPVVPRIAQVVAELPPVTELEQLAS